MAVYNIEWKSSATKELRKLPKEIIEKVVTVVESLSLRPRPVGVKKLTASQNSYRIRINEYRVIYNIYDKNLVIEVIKVRDRKEAYK